MKTSDRRAVGEAAAEPLRSVAPIRCEHRWGGRIAPASARRCGARRSVPSDPPLVRRLCSRGGSHSTHAACFSKLQWGETFRPESPSPDTTHADPPSPHRRPRCGPSHRSWLSIASRRPRESRLPPPTPSSRRPSRARLRIWWRAPNRSGHGHRPRAHRGPRDDDRRAASWSESWPTSCAATPRCRDRLERRRLGQRRTPRTSPRACSLGDRSRRLADRPADRASRSCSTSWRRAPNRYLFPFLLVVFVGDKLITNGIKAARRPRPADAQPDRRDARPVVPERPFLDGGVLLCGARADPRAAAQRTRARAARGQRWRRSRWRSRRAACCSTCTGCPT